MTPSRGQRVANLPMYSTLTVPPGRWADDAGCQGMAPAFDGPLPGEKREDTDARAREAVAVCRSACPVRSECLAWTMGQRRKHRVGVMGGRYWPTVHPTTKASTAA